MEPLAETVVANRIQALLAVAEGHWGRPFPKPVITYDLRGRTAGQAIFRQNRIRINRVLLENNFDAFIKQTVGHELAHFGPSPPALSHIRHFEKRGSPAVTDLSLRMPLQGAAINQHSPSPDAGKTRVLQMHPVPRSPQAGRMNFPRDIARCVATMEMRNF